MYFLFYCFGVVAFCCLIFRSLWYEVARLTNYFLIKILGKNKKYKSKSKKVKLEKNRLKNFFYKDILSFPYEKEARKTATFITIILLIVLCFHSISKFNLKSRDLLGNISYPVNVAFLYSIIFSILLCSDIFLFLINQFLIFKNKKSNNHKELYIKQNLLKADIKEKIFDICKGIVFVFTYLILFFLPVAIFKVLIYNPNK